MIVKSRNAVHTVLPPPTHQSRIASQSRFMQTPSRLLESRPTPFVPDAQTFLTLIGRNLSQHASKIPFMESLFSLTSAQLKELGIELHGVDDTYFDGVRSSNGPVWSWGDFKYVKTGKHRSVCGGPSFWEYPATATLSAGNARCVNWVAGAVLLRSRRSNLYRPRLAYKGAQTIVGPHVQHSGRETARLWSRRAVGDQRGHKIDGGERRQAEGASKERGEERRVSEIG